MTAARRGFTLIECLVAFTLLSSVVIAVSVTVHTLYQADHHLREVLAHDRELERLALDFRADAHLATAVSLNGQNASAGRDLTLKFGQGDEVTYTLQPRQVDRVARRGETVLRRETYRLPRFSTAWQVQAEGGLQVVTLQLNPPPADSGVTVLRYGEQITAVAGMVRPFSTPPPTAGGANEGS